MIKGKLGIEIECICPSAKMDDVRIICTEVGWRIGSDGSIGGARDGETELEIKSKPTDIDDLPEIFSTITKLFKIVRVNSSCGLHVHVSFKDTINYYKLFDWKFVKEFQEWVRSTFNTTIVERERFSNHYCKFYISEENFKEVGERQLGSYGKDGSRYQAINFNAYNLFKTVEFRIFAATAKPTKFKAYLNGLLRFIDTYVQRDLILNSEIKTSTKPPRKMKPVLIREIIKKGE